MSVRIAVIYDSATCKVHMLADASAEGARETGTDVRLNWVAELAAEAAIQQNQLWARHRDEMRDLIEKATMSDLEWAQGYEVLHNILQAESRRSYCRDAAIWGSRSWPWSPTDRGRLIADDILVAIAEKHATPAQVALAWGLRHPDICAIPKARSTSTSRRTAVPIDLELDTEDLELLDDEFPPPNKPQPLEIY